MGISKKVKHGAKGRRSEKRLSGEEYMRRGISSKKRHKAIMGNERMRALLDRGLLSAGDNVLHVDIPRLNASVHGISLNSDGMIRVNDRLFTSITNAVHYALSQHGHNTLPRRVYFREVIYNNTVNLQDLEQRSAMECTARGDDDDDDDDGHREEMLPSQEQSSEPRAWVHTDVDMPSWRSYSKPRGYNSSPSVCTPNAYTPKPNAYSAGRDDVERMDHDVLDMDPEEEPTVNMASPVCGDDDGESIQIMSIRLDMDARASDVVSRIEMVCQFILECIMDKTVPTLSCQQGDGSSKRHFTMDSEKARIRLMRMVLVLNKVHELLCDPSGRMRMTQRDLYYVAKAKDRHLKAPQMMELLRDISHLLRVPRFAMGIDCRSKGLVSGPLILGDDSNRRIDCSKEKRGFPISGSTAELLHIAIECTATCIIVVEKETVFQRLVAECGDHAALQSCLFVTACGYPDLATRILLSRIARQVPDVPMVGIFDWNPHGVHILCQYKYGSKKSIESQACRLENIHWLGVRSAMIRNALSTHDCLQDLSLRDRGIIKTLKKNLEEAGNTSWAQEVQCMEYAGVKADIESLYGHQTMREFCDTLEQKIVRKEWI